MQFPVRYLSPILTLLVTATGASAATAAAPAIGELIRDDFAFAEAQYSGMLERLKDDPGLPRSFRDGKVITVLPQDWTSGFFPGALWLLFEYTGDGKWRRAAENYTVRLESVKEDRTTHDLGFMLFCSYGNGLRLTKNPAYRDVLLRGAETLSTRFDPKLGVIRSWDFGPWKFPVIVDNMMNLELLTWAAKTADQPHWREIAVRHAETTLANHFRPDGSSFHVVSYDPATGGVERKQTWQGAADGSAWARGQAWGFYGFTMMYRETRQAEFLALAEKIAAFVMQHPRMPADKVPYWDFDAPRIPDEPRDASAAAIMASAFIELSTLAAPDRGREYLAFAEEQLRSLSSPAYRAPLGENGNFLLQHCVGNLPGHSEIDQPLAYADYYFLEALLRYRAHAAAPN